MANKKRKDQGSTEILASPAELHEMVLLLQDENYMLATTPEIHARILWDMGAFADYSTCLEVVHQALRELSGRPVTPE